MSNGNQNHNIFIHFCIRQHLNYFQLQAVIGKFLHVFGRYLLTYWVCNQEWSGNDSGKPRPLHLGLLCTGSYNTGRSPHKMVMLIIHYVCLCVVSFRCCHIFLRACNIDLGLPWGGHTGSHWEARMISDGVMMAYCTQCPERTTWPNFSFVMRSISTECTSPTIFRMVCVSGTDTRFLGSSSYAVIKVRALFFQSTSLGDGGMSQAHFTSSGC